jgi:Ca2+/Na+ antiporter
MIALALLLFPLMRTNMVVTRWEGVGLLGVGAVYTGTLVL